MDSLAPFMHHDLSDIGSLIQIQITLNERTLSKIPRNNVIQPFSPFCIPVLAQMYQNKMTLVPLHHDQSRRPSNGLGLTPSSLKPRLEKS